MSDLTIPVKSNLLEVIDNSANRTLLTLKIVDGKLVATYNPDDLDEATKLLLYVMQNEIDRYINERLAEK